MIDENLELMMPSLYIHIPFCKGKCPYCDFTSGINPSGDYFTHYEDYLCREMEIFLAEHPSDSYISTIYLGGGTPSLLSPLQIEKLFTYIRKNFIIKDPGNNN